MWPANRSETVPGQFGTCMLAVVRSYVGGAGASGFERQETVRSNGWEGVAVTDERARGTRGDVLEPGDLDPPKGDTPNHTKILEAFFAQRAQSSLDEHVRPEYQALAKRGNITPAEVAELRCNSWEWEHLIPAMNDEAFVACMEHSFANCGHHKRPYSTYNEAVEGLYAPELLRRFKLMQHKIDGWKREANGYAESIDAIRETLGQKETHYLVMPDDVATLVKALEWYASNPLEKKSYTRAKVVLAHIRGMTVNVTCDRCGRKLILVLEVRPEDEAPATFCAECGGGCVALPPEEVLP
jgi:hypothetical protein